MTSAQKAGVLALTGLSGVEWWDVDKLTVAEKHVLAAPNNPYQGLALGQIRQCLSRCSA